MRALYIDKTRDMGMHMSTSLVKRRIYMAKRKRKLDETVIDRRIKEGRGQGRGKDYKPWLTVQDVPSIGLATRILGWTTGRVHHLFSLLELKDFYTKDWA